MPGFDYFFGIPASLDMPPYVFVENETVEPPSGQIGMSMSRNGGNGYWRAEPSLRVSSILTSYRESPKRLSATSATQARDKPFFLYFALSAPHTPWLPTPQFRGKSQAGAYGDFVARSTMPSARS